MKKVLISSHVQTLEEDEPWLSRRPLSPQRNPSPVRDPRYVALCNQRGLFSDSSKGASTVKPSLQQIHVNEVLAAEPAVCPDTCPALKVHCSVLRSAERRKSEVRLQLRTRQLSQSAFRVEKAGYARALSYSTANPAKATFRVIHSSKTALVGFDTPQRERRQTKPAFCIRRKLRRTVG